VGLAEAHDQDPRRGDAAAGEQDAHLAELAAEVAASGEVGDQAIEGAVDRTGGAAGAAGSGEEVHDEGVGFDAFDLLVEHADLHGLDVPRTRPGPGDACRAPTPAPRRRVPWWRSGAARRRPATPASPDGPGGHHGVDAALGRWRAGDRLGDRPEVQRGVHPPLARRSDGRALVASMVLLGLAVRDLPIGTAYAVWVGIGAIGAAVLGVALFGEPLGPAPRGSSTLLIVALVGLRLDVGGVTALDALYPRGV
jgi:quaternary ammonium compound-resistance protein SugE